jgi:PelA/Pel-15E family pectate lyase
LFHAPAKFRIASIAAVIILAFVANSHAQWGGGQSRWRSILDYPDDFYGSDESRRIAENVLVYQHDNGGWPKNIDMAQQLSAEEQAKQRKRRNVMETLIDNGATYTQIRFLALVHKATGEAKYAEAAQRGIEYLLEAQYENGGWPMIYPIRHGYYQHITFNDGAMIGVMNTLRDASTGKEPFGFVDSDTRERARRAIEKGLDVIFKCQVVVDGRPTAWCAQHDEIDFRPQAARTYELPSLSGYESVGIVEYLMEIDDPSPEVKRAVEDAVAWFEQVKINGLAVRFEREPGARRPTDRVVVEDPSADPIWARFYEIGTNRPMFVGRDGIVHDHLADIERERRVGYAWLGDWPHDLLKKKYPAWHKKWGSE